MDKGYIAQLVAHYLGGRLELMPEDTLDYGMQVGFILHIPLDRVEQESII